MESHISLRVGKTALITIIATLIAVSCPQTAFSSAQSVEFRGKVNNIDVELEKAVFENSKLNVHFKNADGFKGYFTILLQGENGVIPEGQMFRYTKKDMHRNRIYVHYRWEHEGDNETTSGSMDAGEYRVIAKFGKENADNNIPVQVSLKNAKLGVLLRAKCLAQIEGLRLIDGHPDLRSDAIETLHYAVTLYLEDKFGKDVEVERVKANGSIWYYIEKGFGGADAKYKVNGGGEKFIRAWVSKESGQWEVAKELKINELFAAHPLEEINKSHSSDYWKYLVYKKLEEELQREYPNKIFRAPISSSWYRSVEKHGMAQMTVFYTLDDEKDEHNPYQRHERIYLLRRKEDGDWFVERRMDKNEKINGATGEVEKR